MNRILKSILAVVLAACIFISCSTAGLAVGRTQATPAVSVSQTVSFVRLLMAPLATLRLPSSVTQPMGTLVYLLCEYTDLALSAVLMRIYDLFPELDWGTLDTYKNDNFYAGTSNFLDTPAAGARWNIGYGKESIVPANLSEKKYYFGGYIFPLVAIESVYDDQCVRVICVNDGSGRGTTVFAVVDGIGIGNGDVRKIRARLADFARANNIVSINVSCTHSHKCIDTQGLSGNFLISIFTNAIFTAYPFLGGEITSGRDPEFMETLYAGTEKAVKDAYASMTAGRLYYSTADVSEIITDKRDPQVYDKNINTLRFDPDEAGLPDTYIANLGMHPTSVSREDTTICADYPHYMEAQIKDRTGGNFIFFQGAQGAISANRGRYNTGNMNAYEVCEASGRDFADRMLAALPTEKEVAPLFNIKHKEVFVEADNAILLLAIKAQLVNNIAVKKGDSDRDIFLATEIGYAEFGTDLAAMIMPGEIFPEIVWGGAYAAEDSWNRTAWEYPALCDLDEVGDRHVIAIGLANDATGYILPDNDFSPWIADFFEGFAHYEETLSGGSHIASTLVKGYIDMLS